MGAMDHKGEISESGIIRIKNMVCDRCIMSVRQLLSDQGFVVEKVTLGEAVVSPVPDPVQRERLERHLAEIGFELAGDHKQEIVTAIKSGLLSYLKLVEENQDPPLLSEYLAGKLHKSYPTLSRMFTTAEGITIEKYLIRLRIERVKELLSYNEWTLSEIAWRMGYSSVQHLSGQFKSVVGLSVSEYKKEDSTSRQKLDSVH